MNGDLVQTLKGQKESQHPCSARTEEEKIIHLQ